MDYRSLGRSGLRVSCLALGGNIFGRFCDPRETADLVAAAGDAGINVVDTADVYSDGLSEEYLGAAIRGRRSEWIVATKVGVRSDESPASKGRREYIRVRVDASLRRLDTDYIDLYQMHHFDLETPLDETLEALGDLVRQGKVRHVGASNYSGEQLKGAWRAARAVGVPAFVSTQNHYNLFKRELEADVFSVCREVGAGVLVYGALARGVLSGKYRPGGDVPAGSRASVSVSIRGDLTGRVLGTVETLDAFAARRGQTVASLALAWVLRRTEVSAAVVGARNPEQFKANLGAVGWKLDDEDLAEIDAIVGDLDTYGSLSLGSSAARPSGASGVGHPEGRDREGTGGP